MKRRSDAEWQITLPRGMRIQFPRVDVMQRSLEKFGGDIATSCRALIRDRQIIPPNFVPPRNREKLIQISYTEQDSPEQGAFKRIVLAGNCLKSLKSDEVESFSKKFALEVYGLLRQSEVPKSVTKLAARVAREANARNINFLHRMKSADPILVDKLLNILRSETPPVHLRRIDYEFLVKHGLVDEQNDRCLRIGDIGSLSTHLNELRA